MLELFGLIVGGLAAWAATRGRGCRGFYAAAALIALGIGVVMFSIPSGAPPGATDAQRLSAEVIDRWTPSVGLASVFAMIGFAVAAFLFRNPKGASVRVRR